ncbi:copper homeostasis protein CutC [Dactylosporangium fulvum]|uniref:Copper homeostasis protein cutC homolog n=1 Tax=Dactylosporangium fulvum TaxID=53359 RepID=A0ABY5VQK5_9ACTN|nr:copper homeostasis protein CutC [Dactylosporangium fulvum]UWP79404.1 copper homeostasis protein CutC [Dactylosporangium fulvum]
MLEVIALSADDARHAAAGGADRIELVSDMAVGGLSPAPETVTAVRAAVDLPVRVMLRPEAGFTAPDPAALRRLARDLRSAGAEEFVFGFLTAAGAVDLAALDAVLPALDGAPWTFHRAIDHAADRSAAWSAITGLPGLDAVLTAGAPTGVADGLPVLLREAGDPRLLVGGGLRPPHLPPLLAAGARAFHSGAAVRPGGSFEKPIDPDLVRNVRSLLTR